MKILERRLFLVSALLALLTTGCVFIECEHPHPSWPKSVAAKDLHQFEGVYRNHGLDAKTGEAVAGGPELFTEFFNNLIGRGTSHGTNGERVELRSAQDGSSLCVRLFDQQNRQIDCATLGRGAAFAFSGGALVIYGPFSGLRGGSGNLGAGVEYERVKLHLASSGGILGHKSGGGVMLLGYFIPVAGTRERWVFWPQLAE